MAVTKTAKRALRVAKNKKIINDKRLKTMKAKTKEVKALIAKKDIQNANAKISLAFKAIDKAAKRGVIKKGTANRKKSRIAKAIAKLEK